MVTRFFRDRVFAKSWSDRPPSFQQSLSRPTNSSPSQRGRPTLSSPSRSTKSTHLFALFAPQNNNFFSLSNFEIPVYIRGERLRKILAAVPFTCSEIQLLAHEFYSRCDEEQCWDLVTFSSQLGFDETVAARVVSFARNQDLLLEPTNQVSSPYLFLPTRRMAASDDGFTNLRSALQSHQQISSITFEEFLITCTHATPRGSKHQQLNLAFAILDQNHDHAIGKDELFSFMCRGRENDQDAISQFDVLWETLTSGADTDLLNREVFEDNCPPAVLRAILVNQTWMTKILDFTSSVESQRAELEVQRFLLEISGDEDLDVETVEKTGEILNDHFVHTVSDLRTLSILEMKKMGIPNQTASTIQRRVQLKQLEFDYQTEEAPFHMSLQSKYRTAFQRAFSALVIFLFLVITMIFTFHYSKSESAEGASLVYRGFGHIFGHAIFIFVTFMAARLSWNPLSQYLVVGPFYPTSEYIRQLFLNSLFVQCKLMATLCLVIHAGMETFHFASSKESMFGSDIAVSFRMESGFVFGMALIVFGIVRFLLRTLGHGMIVPAIDIVGVVGLTVLTGWHTAGVAFGFYISAAVAGVGVALILRTRMQAAETKVISSHKVSLYPTHVSVEKPNNGVESAAGQHVFINNPVVPLQWLKVFLCQRQKSDKWKFYLFPNPETESLTSYLSECNDKGETPTLTVTRPLGARLDLSCFNHVLFVTTQGFESRVLSMLRNACESASAQPARGTNVYFCTLASEMSKVYWLHNILEELTHQCEHFCPVVFVQTSQSQHRDSNVGLDFLVSFQAGRKVTRGQLISTARSRTSEAPNRAKPEFISFGKPRFRIQKSVKKSFARSSDFDEAFTIPVMAPDFHLLLTCIRDDCTQMMLNVPLTASAHPSAIETDTIIGTIFCGDDLYRDRVERISSCFSDRHCLFEFYDLSP